MSRDIHEIVKEQIINDYFTANIKSEVILDTVLTPIIGEILTVIGESEKENGIKGTMRLLAKEFPILNNRDGKKNGKTDYHSRKADYLMCDDESVYLVELKTTAGSFSSSQKDNMNNYLERCNKKTDTFAETAGREFIKMLNHVSKTGYSDKTWETSEQEDLERLFRAIIEYPAYKDINKKDIPSIKQTCHTDKAIEYLKKNKAVSSKKYLFTAGQMLDHMGDWWEKSIKLLFLVPEKRQKNNENVVFVSFEDIARQKDAIRKKILKEDLKKYWDWTAEILKGCGLFGTIVSSCADMF